MQDLPGESGAVQGAVLAELFARMVRESRTAVLCVRRGEALSQAYFREGCLVGSRVFGRFKPLGISFLEAGVIDIEALNSSLAIIARAQVPQGQVLVEMGAITREQLDQGLRDQMVACAAAFLHLPDGVWSIEEESEYPEWTVGIQADPSRAIIAALRSPEGAPLLQPLLETLGSSHLTLRVEPPQVSDHLDLEPEEARVLAYLDGQHRIEAVAEAAELELPHALALVATLYLFQLVASAGEDRELMALAPPAPETEKGPERAIDLFEAGKTLFDRERYDEALPLLRDAVHQEPDQDLWTVYFAWALYRVGPPDQVVTRVRQMLKLAARSEAAGERARYFLGKVQETEAEDSLDAWL